MMWRYCADQQPLGCEFTVFYNPDHNGGGPVMIEHTFSKEDFLTEHSDCKSVLEVCSGPGFIGWYLYHKLKLDFVNFLDIHAPVEEDIHKTAEYNNIPESSYNFFLSDGFKNYTGEKVDLIVMNPPFYYTQAQFNQHMRYLGIPEHRREHDARITFDPDLKLHKNLIANFEQHLTDNGRIVFLEDIRFMLPGVITSRVNPVLKYDFKQYNYSGKEPDYYTLTYYKNEKM